MIALASGAYAARIDPHGGSLAALTYEAVDLIVPHEKAHGVSAFCGAVLAPWSNRIGDGRYEFAGRTHQLPITEPGRDNALHGLVLGHTWECAEQSDSAVTLTTGVGPVAGYPFQLDLTLTYALGQRGLDVALDARNAGDSAAPYGCGFHPFVGSDTASIDATVLQLQARERLRTDPKRLLPIGREATAGTPYDFGRPRAVGALSFDDAFTGIAQDTNGNHRVRIGRIEIWFDATLPWVQLFTPPGREAIAVEPCTSPPDAFRTGDDLVVIQPGASHRVTWGLADVG